ncbi:MAG TPA: hypothetical protein VKA76_14870 [Gammaproteobacteria bacterium]|nr:hypothetical protein [Gammaproteobacteria bacterium]
MKTSGTTVLMVAIVGVVIATIIGGLSLIGSPSQERMRRLEMRRVADLRGIAAAMDRYWTRHGSLPKSLDALERERGFSIEPTDPETRRPYEYRPGTRGAYSLCADFAEASAQEQESRPEKFWSHGAGRQCFDLHARDLRK